MDSFNGYFGLAVLFRKHDYQIINVYKTEQDVMQAFHCMPDNEDLDWRVIDFNMVFQEFMQQEDLLNRRHAVEEIARLGKQVV